MDYDVALRLEKMKAKRSMWFHYKTLRFSFFKFVWITWKTINVTQSFSFQLYEIIIDFLFKVSQWNVKTMFRHNINKSILSDKAF